MKIITDIDYIAGVINWEVEGWYGECHGVSFEIIKSGIVKGHIERGHYHGFIHPTSLFKNNPLIPHSWIRLEDGRIYDPTRFAFDMKEPYIYISGDDSEYDIGGNKWREAMNKPLPKFDPTKRKIELELDSDTKKLVMAILNYPPFFTINEIFYLGNLPLQSFKDKEYAKRIYTALDKSGNSAVIPIDNYEYIIETHHV